MDIATYQERRFLELIVDVGLASAGLLAGMGNSLSLLNVQLADLRATSSTQLAIQQLMLHRDAVQQHLEELIYQGQKMVEAFSSPMDTTPIVSKALLIRSFYLSVTKAEIGTGMIRGIENKKAFDSLINQLKSLYGHLGQDPAVRKAVAEEESVEKTRQAHEAQREAEEQEQRLEEERLKALVPITVFRASTATGRMLEVEVVINGRKKGAIYGDQSLESRLKPGTYNMEARGGSLTDSLKFTVQRGETISFEVYFSNFGFIGGGLVLRQI